MGLLFLPDPRWKSLGIKLFVGYIGLSIGLSVFAAIMSSAGVYFVADLVWWVFRLTRLVHIAAMLHTHDVTVKTYPHLGQPILFKK